MDAGIGDDLNEAVDSKMNAEQAKALALQKLESSGELTPEIAAMIDEIISVGGEWEKICKASVSTRKSAVDGFRPLKARWDLLVSVTSAQNPKSRVSRMGRTLRKVATTSPGAMNVEASMMRDTADGIRGFAAIMQRFADVMKQSNEGEAAANKEMASLKEQVAITSEQPTSRSERVRIVSIAISKLKEEVFPAQLALNGEIEAVAEEMKSFTLDRLGPAPESD
jgi:hypothetical protein